MKLRAIRCHQTGLSNRSEYDERTFNGSQRAYSLMDSTAGKLSNTAGTMNKTAAAGTQVFKSTAASLINKKLSSSFRESGRPGPLSKTGIFTNQQRNIESVYNGEDMQLQNKRFDTANFRQNEFALSYDGSKPVPEPIEPLQATLNKEVRQIRSHFENKDINMHKIKQIKRAFLQNFTDKHQVKPYYQKYTAGDGRLDQNSIRKLVKDFGFYVTDDQIALMVSLAKNKIDNGKSATIQDFITLTSKPNVYFQTLKLQDRKQLQQKPRIFTKKVHLILRNSFLRLREAMRIYEQQQIPLTQPQFHKVFKKLDLTDLVISKEQIDELYTQFKNPTGTVNQEKLLGAIAEQENLNIMMKKRPCDMEFEDNLTRHKEIKDMLDQKKGITDLRNLSNTDYEKQIKRVRSMLVDVRKTWKNRRQFQKVFKSRYSEEGITNRIELRQNIEKMLQHAGLNYTKKDYDALMSCFKYNVSGGTKFDDIVTTLYDQSEEAFDDRMDRRCRNLPPNIAAESNSRQVPEINQQILQQGLAKIDGRLLHNEFVKTFNNLDTDKDGYVSVKDFESAMQKRQILTNQQMANVVNYLDEDGKGYLNFQEVQQKLHPNIVNEIKKTSLPTLLSKINTKEKWLDSKKTFIASTNKYEYSVPSKYSAWPKHLVATDFSLMQPNDKSGMYATERERFDYKQKDSYGAEEKRRAQSINESKIQKRAMWESGIQQRVEQSRDDEFKKDQQVNHLKRLAQEIYERNCHKQH